MNVLLGDILADLSLPYNPTVLNYLLTILGIYFISLLSFTMFTSQLRARRTRRRWRQRLGFERKVVRVDTVSLLLRFLTIFKHESRDEAGLSRMRKTLMQAGYRTRNAPTIFLNLQIFLAVLLPMFFFLLYLPNLQWLSYSATLLTLVVLAAAGFFSPSLLLQMRIKSRRQKIAAGFPDALDLMVVCVESGLGLDAAIHQVGQEIGMNHKVLGEEFQLVDFALRVGQSREEALRGMGIRTGMDDINSFVTLIVQTDKFGGNVAPALRVHADAMRTNRQQRAEEKAAKLPVKLLFPLIFFIFPALFVVVVGPAVMQLYEALTNRG